MSTGKLPTVSPPLVLDRYRLIKRLGTGAFGTVYSARDERLERDVAVKLLPRERNVGGRFEREARAAARLSHPGIVTLYEAAVDDDGAYLVTELVRGSTLDRLLESGRLSDRDILEIGVTLTDALAHAHALGVIHRDVKPSNVLVPARRGPASPAAKLTDFGVARVVGGVTLTQAGDVVGTLDYMAPEQAAGRDAGPQADLYSLALVLYEALTGVSPEAGRTPAPLRRQRRGLPRALGIAIDRALRPRPHERGELADLRSALVEARPLAAEVAGVVAPSRVRAATAIRASAATAATAATARGRDAQRSAWGARRNRPGSAAEPTAGGTYASARSDASARPRVDRPWPERGLTAATGALAAGWLAAHLLASPPLAPVAFGLLAGVATLLLPRLGWLVTIGALVCLAAVGGRAGDALLLVALATTTAIVLIPAQATAIAPLPAAAAMLGLVGLGTVWPALAGRSGLSFARRAALSGLGFVWCAAAGALTGRAVPWRPAGLPRPEHWIASATTALHHVLIPAVTGAMLPAALVWALAAALLPLLTRRPPLPLAAVIAGLWAAATLAGTEAAGARNLHGAAAGALVAAAIAAAPALAALVRQARRRAVADVPLP